MNISFFLSLMMMFSVSCLYGLAWLEILYLPFLGCDVVSFDAVSFLCPRSLAILLFFLAGVAFLIAGDDSPHPPSSFRVHLPYRCWIGLAFLYLALD